jgi:hypothetical protein
MIAALLLSSAASFYFLGALKTVRLALAALMVCAIWGSVKFAYLLRQALRSKQVLTLYGPVALADRPILFWAMCVLSIAWPLGLLGFLILKAQAPEILLFRWLWFWK